MNKRQKVCQLNRNIGKKSTITWHTEVLDVTANVERKYAFPNLPKHTTSFPILCEGSKGISGVVVAKDILKDGGVIVLSPVTQQVRILLIVID